MEWPELLQSIDQTLFGLKFTSSACESMQNALLSYWQDTIAVDKRALLAHIENEGLAAAIKPFIRERNLAIAAMGGVDADIAKRQTIWLAEAQKLIGQENVHAARDETRGRLVDTIRSDKTDALQRLSRATGPKRS